MIGNRIISQRECDRCEDTVLAKEFREDAVNLSGGETQQFLLARALYKDAPFVILDEPTAVLDPIAEAKIYAVFHEAEEGRFVIK